MKKYFLNSLMIVPYSFSKFFFLGLILCTFGKILTIEIAIAENNYRKPAVLGQPEIINDSPLGNTNDLPLRVTPTIDPNSIVEDVPNHPVARYLASCSQCANPEKVITLDQNVITNPEILDGKSQTILFKRTANSPKSIKIRLLANEKVCEKMENFNCVVEVTRSKMIPILLNFHSELKTGDEQFYELNFNTDRSLSKSKSPLHFRSLTSTNQKITVHENGFFTQFFSNNDFEIFIHN